MRNDASANDIYLSVHLRLCCLVAHLVIRGSEPDLGISYVVVGVLVKVMVHVRLTL